MITRLKGIVFEATPLLVVIETGGIGYEVHIPVTTAEKVPAAGQECQLFTHAIYREDSATLYGFANCEDRNFFRLLVEKVAGIGPKIAIGILSRIPVELLRNAIADSDVALLSKCPGIGKKTAERLVIELKDKVFSESRNRLPNKETDVVGLTPQNEYQDAVASLVTLGYKPADADKLVYKASTRLPADASVERLIRTALS